MRTMETEPGSSVRMCHEQRKTAVYLPTPARAPARGGWDRVVRGRARARARTSMGEAIGTAGAFRGTLPAPWRHYRVRTAARARVVGVSLWPAPAPRGRSRAGPWRHSASRGPPGRSCGVPRRCAASLSTRAGHSRTARRMAREAVPSPVASFSRSTASRSAALRSRMVSAVIRGLRSSRQLAILPSVQDRSRRPRRAIPVRSGVIWPRGGPLSRAERDSRRVEPPPCAREGLQGGRQTIPNTLPAMARTRAPTKPSIQGSVPDRTSAMPCVSRPFLPHARS